MRYETRITFLLTPSINKRTQKDAVGYQEYQEGLLLEFSHAEVFGPISQLPEAIL
jgi:hypothetical protein